MQADPLDCVKIYEDLTKICIVLACKPGSKLVINVKVNQKLNMAPPLRNPVQSLYIIDIPGRLICGNVIQ